jgi:hypothetical protein
VGNRKTTSIFCWIIILTGLIAYTTFIETPTLIKDTKTNSSSLRSDPSFNSFIVAQAQKPESVITCEVDSTLTIGYGTTIKSEVKPYPNANAEQYPFIAYFEYSDDGGSTWNIIEEVYVDSFASFRASWKPDKVGSYLVRVYWNGNNDYQGAESIHRLLEVEKIVSTISCSIYPSWPINPGNNVRINGDLSPEIANAKIAISYRKSGGTWNDILTVSTDSKGRYSYWWTPTSTGSFEVRVSWIGDENHFEAENGNTVVVKGLVAPTSSSISCSASPSSILVGSSTTISGFLSPAIADADVTLSYRLSGGIWSSMQTVSTTSLGSYSYDWTPTSAGTYEVKASWSGDETYEAAENSATITVTDIITSGSSSISCSASPSSILVGSSTTISGSLSPAIADTDVTLSYRLSGSWNSLQTVSTDSSGSYSYDWTPNSAGTYQVKASWIGNIDYEETTSSSVSIKVNEEETGTSPDIFSRPEVISVLIAAIGLVGGGYAAFRNWEKTRKYAKNREVLLDQVKEVLSSFKMNPRRCEAELNRIRDEALDYWKTGEIDESTYDGVKNVIDEEIQEIQRQINNK